MTEEELRQLVCRKVECVRCSGFQSYNLSYRSADAQRFYCSKSCHDLGEMKPAIGVDPAVPGSDINGIQVVADKNVPKEWVYISTPPKSGKSALLRALEKQSPEMAAIYAQQGGLRLSDYVFRQGDYQRQGQLQYGTCPECSQQCWIQLSQVCAACGATAKSIEAKRARPACKCGATENVRRVAWGQHRCGSCEQSRRRAELQAQKLEQTKRAMNRPVKRDPYEWLGFSSADWEE